MKQRTITSFGLLAQLTCLKPNHQTPLGCIGMELCEAALTAKMGNLVESQLTVIACFSSQHIQGG